MTEPTQAPNSNARIKSDDEEQQFWDLVDGFIGQANAACDEAPTSTVSSALLYAAARFNAFIASAEALSAEQLKSQRSGAVDFFNGQYRGMLAENLDDYIDNFEESEQ